VLAAAGGAAGVLVALAGAALLARVAPDALAGTVPRAETVRVDGPVLAFAVSAAAAVALVLGAIAGWRAVRAGASAAGGGVGALAARERAGTGGRAAARARSGLVAAQVALTAVLLVGAGLLARTFVRLASDDLGFRPAGALAVNVAFPDTPDSASDRSVRRTADAVVARLRALPGVRAAGATNSLPVWGGNAGSGTFIVQSRPDEIRTMDDWVRVAKDPSRTGEADYRRVTDGYFESMGIPVSRGRTFTAGDGADAPPVAVITGSLARARFAGREPIGQLIQFGNMDGDVRPMTVVGVVGDVREALGAEPQPTVYGLVRQRPAVSSMTAVLAPAPGGPPLGGPAMLAAARRAVREVDPTLPVRVRPMEEVFARALAGRRFALVLAAAFAVAALALAATGLYGVVAYVAAQRRRELGVRVALGARAADVRRLVLGRGLAPAAVGLVAGLAAALAAGRVLAAQLYGVRPADPATFAAVAVALGVVAVAAAWGPARRRASAPLDDPVDEVARLLRRLVGERAEERPHLVEQPREPALVAGRDHRGHLRRRVAERPGHRGRVRVAHLDRPVQPRRLREVPRRHPQLQQVRRRREAERLA
jgi:predicted permease